MKILSFDNTRVAEFVNKNVPDIEKMFWPELTWLAAYFWAHAYDEAVKVETKKNPGKYLGNITESLKLAEEKRKDVDRLYDQMIGMMKEYHK